MTLPLLAGYTLLVVDDDPAMHPLLMHGLARFGARSIEAVSSARQLRQRLLDTTAVPLDAVVLDHRLCGTETGIDLAQWMCTQPHLATTIRILYSGYVTPERVTMALAQHVVHGVINKPQTLPDLAASIAAIVTAARSTT